MSQQTYIKGKECSLETTIAVMQKRLDALGLRVEEGEWLNPVAYVHSLLIYESTCKLLFTNGKGSCKKSCQASALGEFFERMSCNYFFADYYLGATVAQDTFVHYPNERWFEVVDENLPKGLLNEELWEFYNPDDELHPAQLFDFNSGLEDRGICALPFHRLRDDTCCYFPVNILDNLYVSNGMAAGNTKAEARVQALCEIFERYVKNRIIAEGIALPDVPKEVISRFPHIEASLAALESHGYVLKVADASLGGQFPVVSVTLINPKNGSVFASFGAHPCFEVALERTVTELMQGRGFDNLDDFQAPSFNSDEVASDENLETHFINATGLLHYDFFKQQSDYEFVAWNHDATTQSEFEYLSEMVHEMGCDIYIADYEHMGVYACRIIVPGVSEIYPVDDLIWSNNSEGARFREPILSLKNLHVNELTMLFSELEEAEIPDVIKVAEFIGIAPDSGTVWERLQMGELKAMIALATQEYERALEWVVWTLYTAQLNEASLRHYRCLQALLEIALDEERELAEYEEALSFMYISDSLAVAKALVSGTQKFYGLHSPGLSLEGFNTHASLLAVYEKLHAAKLG
jgi:ribosomal protein S12 methylthiotransferase accessory factor